ncbi:MAG TPA: MSMEG_0567/Sll0786 family nitrogen starvation N-acetyltransferase [Solirubrobacteraceae bacterium]|nr:MSMEG_0567/Sll0786 family nitrogen starvation N-acetyltransferase [Solirubrobacteraceae bacterium]
MPGASSRSTTVSSAGAGAIECRVACGDDLLEAHFDLRRAVFVSEQELFVDDDRDDRDDDPATLHAVGLIDGEPCGAVRLYPLEPTWREWKGDRLAVLAELRTHHLGAELVRFAVATAGRLGGARMIAHVQLPNVRFFERLGWTTKGTPAPFHGVDHQLMSIPLDRGA